MKNILCVGAHPDDIELMAGGTIIKSIAEGKNVFGLVLTNGSWKGPTGETARSSDDAKKEAIKISKKYNFKLSFLDEPTMDIKFEDRLVVEVLKLIEQYSIDTLILPWVNDLHKDHQTVAKIGISASRRVPRVLFGQINYFLHDFFTPNMFVDISETYINKIEMLSMYDSVWQKSGEDWEEFLNSTHTYYGKMVGVKKAEGFISQKYLI